jgi:hypothetical protein
MHYFPCNRCGVTGDQAAAGEGGPADRAGERARQHPVQDADSVAAQGAGIHQGLVRAGRRQAHHGCAPVSRVVAYVCMCACACAGFLRDVRQQAQQRLAYASR